MNKFSTLMDSVLKEAEKNTFNFSTNVSHESDTLSHPLKDRMMKMLETWIKEAEHQDGKTFWDNFSEPQDAVEDFLKFVEFKNPKI